MANRGKVRRRKIVRATPRWLTAEHRLAIHRLYCEAKHRNRVWRGGRSGPLRQTRRHYDVDHIVPLSGANVCGLHVPWNLRVVTVEENNRKADSLLVEVGALAPCVAQRLASVTESE